MALEVKQTQETGTVGNLCAADKANASVNRKGDQTPVSVYKCLCACHNFLVITVQTDALKITKSLITFVLKPKTQRISLNIMVIQSVSVQTKHKQSVASNLRSSPNFNFDKEDLS